MNAPWTQNELDNFIPKLRLKLNITEAQVEGIRPLPPMTEEESLEFLYRLLDIASTRPLTQLECATLEQLFCVFKQAIQAEMLGLKGRFYVIDENQAMKVITKK